MLQTYPDLKANQNFRAAANRTGRSRGSPVHGVSGGVRDLNDGIQRFPASLIANAFDFKAAEFFHSDDDARVAPKVEGLA